MNSSVQESLRKLTEFSESLNSASDNLTEELASIEDALNKLKLGVNAWVNVTSEDLDGGYVHSVCLGYDKVKGRWGLFIVDFIDTPDDNDPVPLRECARDLRIDATGKIEALLEALVANVGETAKKVSERAATVKQIASSLSNGRKK